MNGFEEQYAAHPYDPACVCKLCDWRREGVKADAGKIGVPAALDKLSAKTIALSNVIDTQEKLQESWNRPTVVRFGPTKVLLLTLSVCVEDSGFAWHASARIKHHKKAKLKAVASWTVNERAEVASVLDKVLDGCGVEPERPALVEATASTWSLHLSRPVSAKELGIILRPSILGGPDEAGH